MEKEVFDYQTMRMQQDAQEAIAAEQAWLAAGGDAGEHPDQGYNQWIRFNFKLIDFPDNLEIVLQSLNDVKIDCGRLFLETKDIVVEPGFLPRRMEDQMQNPLNSRLGVCGRYCAAMGTMGKLYLRERDKNEPGKLGEVIVSIYWKCLYQSYSKNVFYALMHRRDYEVEYSHDYPKDTAIGDVTIRVKHTKLYP